MKALLACALLALACAPAGAEKFGAEKREFSSPNRKYSAAVAYSGINGGGRARLELRGASGKQISVFESDSAPFTVTVSDDGQRLFLFCGAWGQAVKLFTLKVHAASGELLAQHQLPMDGPAGESFSEDGAVYAVGADQGDKRAVLVLDAGTGRALWRKTFKERLSGLKLAASGGKLLAVFVTGEGRRRAVVFDRAGAELWRGEIKTSNNLTPRIFGRGGAEFELWEDRMVYDERDGYWHNRLLKKRSYRFEGGAVREIAVKELNEAFK